MRSGLPDGIRQVHNFRTRGRLFGTDSYRGFLSYGRCDRY